MSVQGKIVKAQEKGLVTIPVEFREQLGIQKNSLLEAKLTKEGVLFIKLNLTQKSEELYSNSEIEQWMEEDRLDVKTIKKLDQLLGKKK